MNRPDVNSNEDAQAQGDKAQGDKAQLVGDRITGWTNNLLATAVVLIIALVGGNQLISSWRSDQTESDAADSFFESWPSLQSCGLEFGDAPFHLQREIAVGRDGQIREMLIDRCRRVLENDPQPMGEVGRAEQQLIERSAEIQPIEILPGRWRIFNVQSDLDVPAALPMVVGIRDDWRELEHADTPLVSRLVVWGLALGSGADQWTLYVGQATETSACGMDLAWLPDTAKRTMAISDLRGGALIGFSGEGQTPSTIEFYKRLASDRSWKVVKPWQASSNDSWSARYALPSDSEFAGLQVQVSNHNRTAVRGLLMLRPNHPKPPQDKQSPIP